ncbi:MFS transporter [Celeribacter arenosi]
MNDTTMRKRIWGWYFFDWASQPYNTLLLTFIYGPFFAAVAASYFMGTGLSEVAADARAQSVWSLCLTLVGIAVGIGAPVVGALADTTGRRIPWVIFFSGLYVIGASLLWFTDPAGGNMWLMLAAFGVGFIGAEFALIFTNAQLPTLGSQEEIGKVSGTGFAFGYLGGLIALVLALGLLVEQESGLTLFGVKPLFGLDAAAREGTRFVGPFTALWFALFMVPYFMWVHDLGATKLKASFSGAMASLKDSVTGLRHRRSMSAFLIGSMFYRDALNGIYSFGGVYAKLVLNWSLTTVGIFGIVSIIAAAVFAWIGGRIDKRIGPKPVIIATIVVLTGVCFIVVGMSREQLFGMPLPEGSTLPDTVFFVCGVLIGGMGGMLQSSSRTLMTLHTTLEKSTQAFGLYGLTGRATAFMAPALIGIVTAATGSARLGVTPLIVLFLIGLILLAWVNPRGEREA